MGETIITKEMRQEQIAATKAYEKTIQEAEVNRITAEAEVHLTRQLVIEGTGYREKVYIPGGYVWIRPLNDKEYGTVSREILKGITSDELKLLESDVSKAHELNERATYQAVSIAIVDEEDWNVEDVARLPPGAPEKIYRRVAIISGFHQASMIPGTGGRLGPGPTPSPSDTVES